MEYPKEYSEADIAWLQEHFEPEYQAECRARKNRRFTHYLNDDEAICRDHNECILRYNVSRLESLGDERLVKLYLNYCDIEATALDLGLRESNLRSHLARIRAKLEKLHISPTVFDRILRS